MQKPYRQLKGLDHSSHLNLHGYNENMSISNSCQRFDCKINVSSSWFLYFPFYKLYIIQVCLYEPAYHTSTSNQNIWVLRPFQEHCTYIEPIVNQRWAKTGVPEKKHLTYQCRTWHLTCAPSEVRTTAVRDLMFKSPHS